MRFTRILALISFAACSTAVDIEGRIQWNEVCPDGAALGQAKVQLDGGRQGGGIGRDGVFKIPDVNPGSYILSVAAHDHTFDNLRIDVLASNSTPEVRPYVLGTPHNPPSVVTLPYPVALIPRQRNVYFVERSSFNVMGMLRNPMMLMMVVTGGLVLLMPYLMKNLDPELAKEISDRQSKLASIQSSMQSGDFKAGLTALMDATGDTPEADHSERPPSQSAKKAHGGKQRSKRR